jgi:hypothetical protein
MLDEILSEKNFIWRKSSTEPIGLGPQKFNTKWGKTLHQETMNGNSAVLSTSDNWQALQWQHTWCVFITSVYINSLLRKLSLCMKNVMLSSIRAQISIRSVTESIRNLYFSIISYNIKHPLLLYRIYKNVPVACILLYKKILTEELNLGF